MSKVLIIEDSADDVELTKRMLTREGLALSYHVVSSLEAVRENATGDVDCVLTDYHLPGFTAHDVLQALSEKNLTASVIVLTGSLAESEVLSLLRKGARNVIMKDHLEWLPSAVRDGVLVSKVRREHGRTQESLAAFKRAIDSSPDPVFWLGQDRRLDYVNEGMCRLLGRGASELLAADFPTLVQSQTRPCEEFWRDLISTGRVSTEISLRRADGQSVIIDIAATMAGIGEKQFAFCIGRDVTQLRASTEALRASEQRWRALIENSSDAVLTADETGRILYCSRGGERMLGFPVQEVVGHYIMEFLHPEDIPLAERILQQVLAQPNQPTRATVRIRHRDGDWRIIEGVIENRLNDPAIRAIVDNFWDVTELTRATEQLHLIEAAISQANEAIIITSAQVEKPGPQILYANPAMARMCGYEVHELIGKTPRMFQGPRTDRTVIDAMRSALLQARQFHGDVWNYRKDGTEYLAEININSIRNAAGKVTHFVSVLRDVTDVRREQARIAEAQRLESIGVLASGIAHDLNNILTPIAMGVEIMRVDTVPDPEILDTISSAAERGTGLVKQLLTFAKGARGEPRPVDVRQSLHEIELIITRTFPKSIALVCDVRPETPIVMVDPVHLHQILLNLCVNARDAMPKGGELHIQTACIDVDEAMAAMMPRGRPGTFLELKVRDTGSGIPQEVMHRIFEPFFTTKPIGKGTGLGLSTVLGIVESYQGFIDVQTAPGRGSTFAIYLPAAKGAVVAQTVPPQETRRGRGETVLLADDEQSIRTVIGRALTAAGYKVLDAEDGAAAIALLARELGRVSLIITDVTMPVMDGMTLIRAAKRIDPHLPIIAMTGVSEATRDAELREIGAEIVLVKPFASPTLLSAISSVFNQPAKPTTGGMN